MEIKGNMKRKDIISITGDLASGQSTVSKMLAEELNYYLYRNGEYCRNLAVKNGVVCCTGFI